MEVKGVGVAVTVAVAEAETDEVGEESRATTSGGFDVVGNEAGRVSAKSCQFLKYDMMIFVCCII